MTVLLLISNFFFWIDFWLLTGFLKRRRDGVKGTAFRVSSHHRNFLAPGLFSFVLMLSGQVTSSAQMLKFIFPRVSDTPLQSM